MFGLYGLAIYLGIATIGRHDVPPFCWFYWGSAVLFGVSKMGGDRRVWTVVRPIGTFVVL